MTKPTLVFTRPAQWENLNSDYFKLIHAPIFGTSPRLRNEMPMTDSVGGIATRTGLDKLIKIFDAYMPDVFLFWATYFDDTTTKQVETIRETLKVLKLISPKTLFVYGNGNQQGHIDFNVEAFKESIDMVVTNTRNPHEFKMFNDIGIQYVDTLYSFGFEPSEHGGKPDQNFDCFFGGSQTFHPKRRPKYLKSEMRLRFLEAVNRRFKLKVCGKGVWTFPTYPYLYGNDYYKTMKNSKINLGMNHWDIERYYTKRTIYALASGRLYLTHYIPGMEKDFTKGKHLDWFHTVDEGLAKIRYYLDNKEEREAIGNCGREIAICEHSWEARLRNFEQVIIRM